MVSEVEASHCNANENKLVMAGDNVVDQTLEWAGSV